MESRKIFIISTLIFAAIVIAGLGGWYIYRDFAKKQPAPQTPEKKEIVVPDLDKEIVIAGNINEETKITAIAKIKEIIASLKKDYDQREEWLNLGIWRKTIGDYEGTREAWEFVTLIRPNDAVAYHNLGDLYSQYIIDFAKAEKYYLTAVEKEPKATFYYSKLFEFYRYYVKKPDLAENILEQGIKATNDPVLQTILDDYRKNP